MHVYLIVCQAMRESIRRFIAKDINPHVEDWEKQKSFPARQLFKAMGNQGFLGVNRAVSDGGLGLDYSYNLAIAEELGSIRCGAIPMAIGVQVWLECKRLDRHP